MTSLGPIRIGCDLVTIDRIGRLSESEAFLKKVFHPVELGQVAEEAGRVASLAARFAAKEAFSKALGTGLYVEGIRPCDIWVERDASGKPCLFLSPHVWAHVKSKGFTHIDVSLSHEGNLAMAVVLLS